MSKKKSHKKALVVLGIIAGIILIFCIVFRRQIKLGIEFFERADFAHQDTGYTAVSIELTAEQRLRDFDYMYDLVCLQYPGKEYIEEQFGISYQEIYDRYRDKILAAEDEYDYYSLLTCFLCILPGQHNSMLLPDFEKKVVNGSYSLNERLWTQDVKDHVSTWHDAFRERVLSYDQRGLLFNYYDGAYYAETSSVFEVVPEYLGARLISLNGKSIDDMVFDVYERYVPRYDSENDKFFRTSLIFNESAGEKYTAELEMPDGKIVTVDIFDDPGFDLAVVDRKQIYPEDLTSGTEDTADKNESAAGTENKPVSYFIAEDAGRKLVYIRYNSCYLPEAERLADDIRTSLNNVGAEYIILDIRGNRGGDSTAVTKYLCPELFKDDLTFIQKVKLPDNELSEYFSDSPLHIGDGFSHFRKKDGYITYNIDYSVDGRAEKEYKVYVLVSPTTFSSGDIMTRIAKEYSNAVLIGSNTGGEGISGSIFNDCLPESRFVFSYAPSLNIDYPEDSVYGTEPDIHMHMLKEYYDKADDIEASGTDPSTYEGRQLWDGVLCNTLAMIDEQNS